MSYVLAIIAAIPVSFAALLPVINPIGTAIILLSLTEGASYQTRRALAKTVAFNTIILLTVLLLGGSYLLAFFGISVSIVQVAGGLILASMGWQMLHQQPEMEKKTDEKQGSETDFSSRAFYPFTFPITVGPGGVAVTLTLSAHTTHEAFVQTALGQAGAIVGIIGIGISVYLGIAYCDVTIKRLGPTALSAMMRLMSFIIVCLGAQICWTGFSALIREVK